MALFPEARAAVEAAAADLPVWSEAYDVEAARAANRTEALAEPPEDVAEVRDFDADGVPVRLYRPEGAADGMVVHLHGGGFVFHDLDVHDRVCRRFANRLDMGVLSVGYRLAPEHPFPAALDDVRAVYAGLLENVDAREVVLGAESSGAALALALLVDVKNERPLPAAAFFISGHFDMTLSGMSMASREAVDPVTTRESLERAAAWYTRGADRASPRVSPIFAPLDGLPPLLLQVGDDEILLDDSTRVAAAVSRSGGRAELSIWPGMWHAWPMHPDLPEADEALAEIRGFLERCSQRNGSSR